MTKWVYSFGDGKVEGDGGMTDLLGGKGAGLAEMCRLGLPVPPGFTITTEACTHYFANGETYPDGLKAAVEQAVADIGSASGARFGAPANPLLVSVRSGARVSMPGMMDTVLNLGLNTITAEGLAQRTGDARFAYDSYRRFIQMYAGVVLGVDHAGFESILDDARDARGVELDTGLDAEDLKAVAAEFKAHVARELGKAFPEDVNEQLWSAIGAVFGSWNSPRAKTYRRLNAIPEKWGTAVTVQAMVFGNRGDTSATGVAFTRDPASGEKILYGEFLVNAQGEDVVAGIRTPQPITQVARARQKGRRLSMEEAMPDTYAQLKAIGERLEAHHGDMQDVEFTVQEGKLYLLQARAGKRTAEAALRIAIAMEREGLISRDTALLRVEPAALDRLLHPVLDPGASRQQIAQGLGASPGAAMGAVVFTGDEAETAAAEGRDVILVRAETSPDDIGGMDAARGILTVHGGMTSHAAVVARGMGKPCVCGAGMLKLDVAAGVMHANNVIVKRGDIITIDGASGQVFLGAVKMRAPELADDFVTLMRWADTVCDAKPQNTQRDSRFISAARSPFHAVIARLVAAQAALKK